MLTKIVIIFILFAIFFALGSGLYYLVKEGNQGMKTVKALSWRIGLTIFLLIFLLVASHFGLIQPHNVDHSKILRSENA
jgi:putative copper export protein